MDEFGSIKRCSSIEACRGMIDRTKCKYNRKDCQKKGFTLVELIVVLVILAILAAFLVPALTGYIDKAKAAQTIAEAKHLQSALQTTAVEFYNENNGTWGNWNQGTTSYHGITGSLEGNNKLRAFIADAVKLSEVTDIRNYMDSSGSRSFYAKLNKSGKIEMVVFFDETRYAVIDAAGTSTCEKAEAGYERSQIVNTLLGTTIHQNYGGNALKSGQSYVSI